MLYMDKIRQRLSDLGYAIYDAPAPVGSYVQCVRTGNLLHLSGGISVNGDDKYFGKVGQELTVEEGQAAARAAILNRLAVIVQGQEVHSRGTDLLRIFHTCHKVSFLPLKNHGLMLQTTHR